MRKQLTGEPVAGEPHTGFGGRGRPSPFPTPILTLLDRRQIQLLDDVNNESGQMIFRQPLLYTRRKQKLRVAVDRNKTRHRLTHGRTSMQLSVVKVSEFKSPTDC